jgi:protoporphyrinogen/coproporphyrinogen III oxidase
MKIVVVGTGITGLAAAYSILKDTPNVDLTMLESSGRIGGIISTKLEDGCVIEEGPDSFLTTKPWALDLCLELGLADQVMQTNDANRRAFIAAEGRLVPLPEGFFLIGPRKIWPFIDSPILSARGKIVGILELFRAPARNVINETIKDFVVRRFGDELFEKIAQPMVGGIYTGDPEKLSANATLPQFVEMERQYGSVIRGLLKNNEKTGNDSGARYSAFVTLKPGLQCMVDALADKIGRDRIILENGLRTLSRSGNTWKLKTSGGQLIEADIVVLACPARSISAAVSDLDAKLAFHLNEIAYSSSVIISLIFDSADISHPMDGFGFVVPERERRSIIACTFSSIKFKGRAPLDKVLMRVFLGGALHPEIFALSDSDLIKTALDDLKTYLGIARFPEKIWIRRWANSMPQYYVGHLELVRQIKDRFEIHPGLIWGGSALSGVGIPDCVRSGLAAAQSVRAFEYVKEIHA